MKTALLDCVFARDGLKLQRDGGPWATCGWWGDTSRRPSTFMDAWWADADLDASMNPFSIQPDGLHIALREFTPTQKARFFPNDPEIQAARFWSGQLRLQHPDGPPESFYPLHPNTSLGWQGRPRRTLPNIVEIDPQGCYLEIRSKVAPLAGIWSQAPLYSYDGAELFEFDPIEVQGKNGTSNPNYHKHFGPTQAYPGLRIDTNIPTRPADGSAPLKPGGQFVTIGMLLTPKRVRAYQNDILTADYAIEDDIREPMMLQLANQALAAGSWLGETMAVADLPNADFVIESVRVFSLN